MPDLQRSCKAALWTAPDTEDPVDEADHGGGEGTEEGSWLERYLQKIL